MTYARSILVPPGLPGTYQGVSRCVRLDWLCGEYRESGRSSEHRRRWLEDRIDELTEIDVRCAKCRDLLEGCRSARSRTVLKRQTGTPIETRVPERGAWVVPSPTMEVEGPTLEVKVPIADVADPTMDTADLRLGIAVPIVGPPQSALE